MVSNTADITRTKQGASVLARAADRWIYVFMAGLCIVTALIGFVPDSMRLLEAVEAGERPPLPPVLHAHALLMGSWLSLLLVQTTLMATGRRSQHMSLGILAASLLPFLALAMIGTVQSSWSWIASIPAVAMPAEALNSIKFLVSNILLEQIRIFFLFVGLVTLAILLRRTNPEWHKRLMILAPILALPAATDRMTWVPTTLPESPLSIHLVSLLLFLPLLAYDIARRGRIHSAYMTALALNVPFLAASYYLWGSDWWLATAPHLVGVDGW